MNKEILTKLKHKSRQKVEASVGNLKRIQRYCPSMQRSGYKSQSHLELNMARDVKGNKKGFYKHISSRRKTSENVGLIAE